MIRRLGRIWRELWARPVCAMCAGTGRMTVRLAPRVAGERGEWVAGPEDCSYCSGKGTR